MERAAYEANRTPATYGFDAFKAEVVSWLQANFGDGVTPGKKAIAVPGNGGDQTCAGWKPVEGEPEDVDVISDTLAVYIASHNRYGARISRW